MSERGLYAISRYNSQNQSWWGCIHAISYLLLLSAPLAEAAFHANWSGIGVISANHLWENTLSCSASTSATCV